MKKKGPSCWERLDLRIVCFGGPFALGWVQTCQRVGWAWGSKTLDILQISPFCQTPRCEWGAQTEKMIRCISLSLSYPFFVLGNFASPVSR